MTEEEVSIILAGILKHWKTLSPAELKSLLKILIVRGDLPICPACKQPILTIQDNSFDHVIPESKGGPTEAGNLQPMHKWCNVEKDDEIYEQYFCHVDPELLAQMIKQGKAKGSHVARKSKQRYDNEPKGRRNHVRIKGGCDMTSFNNSNGRHR